MRLPKVHVSPILVPSETATRMSTTKHRALLSVAAFAAIVLVLSDIALQSTIPLAPKPREVSDGVRDLRASNPETLVIGSSHARTFHVLGLELQRRQRSPSLPLVAIPLENGKLVPYLWMLEHRIAPIIDSRTRRQVGAPPRLRRMILLTEWWDSCDHLDRIHWNVPSRAWSALDYLQDVAANGINDYNRNFPRTVLRELGIASALIQDRTNPRIKEMILERARARPYPPPRTDEVVAAQLKRWQSSVERGVSCIGAPDQMAALDSILKFARERNLEMTVVLFPRKPATFTERGRITTIKRFADTIAAIASDRGVRLIDLTTSTPLTDFDFMDDFDHVNAAGNLKFAEWALANDLKFLLERAPLPAGAPRAAEAQQ